MADDDLTQYLKDYYGLGTPNYFSQTDTEARYPLKTPFPGDKSLYQGEIRNLPDRPSDPIEAPVAQSLSPTMGAYGMGQLAGDTITKASDPLGPNYGGIATNLPMLLSIFAGPGARAADLAALAKAHEMSGKALNRGDIWNETGWFQGPDDKWRFEIPDNEAYYAAKGYQGGINGDKILPDVLGHDALYRAYPDMKGIAAAWKTGPQATEEIASGHPKAGYGEHPDLGELIGGLGHNKEDLVSSFLHEAQHAIQTRESFAPGGNGEMFTPEQIEAARNRMSSDPFSGESDLTGLTDRQLAFEMYQRLAGEVEARNTQKRQDFTPNMRRNIPPWETQDYPNDSQIIAEYTGKQLSKEYPNDLPPALAEDTTAGPERRYPGDPSLEVSGEDKPEEPHKMTPEQFGDYLAAKYGADVNLAPQRDDIKLQHIAVPAERRGQGTGSAIMQELNDYADANGKRVILSPAQKDDGFGTTSRGRLVSVFTSN